MDSSGGHKAKLDGELPFLLFVIGVFALIIARYLLERLL
jgi:hypothetical protein